MSQKQHSIGSWILGASATQKLSKHIAQLFVHNWTNLKPSVWELMFQLEAAQELFHKLERCIWLQCLVKACKVQTSCPGRETIVGGCQLENFHPISQWLEGSKDVVQVPVVIVTWAHLDVFQQEHFGVPVTDGIYDSPESNHWWCILHRSKQRWLKQHTWLNSTLTWHLTCLTS